MDLDESSDWMFTLGLSFPIHTEGVESGSLRSPFPDPL